MSTRRHKPREDQPPLEFPSKRGQELDALKRIRLGDPYARLILFVLDSLIGSQRSYWDLSIEELIEACEMSRTTFYGRLKSLQDLRLVNSEPLPNTIRRRWRLIRSNIADYVAHQKAAESHQGDSDSDAAAVHQGTAGSPHGESDPIHGTAQQEVAVNSHQKELEAAEGPSQERQCPENYVRQANSAVREADDPVRETDASVRHTDGRVRETDDTTIRTNHVPPPPPPRTVWTEGAAAVARSMVEAGVRFPTRAIEQAFARGCSADQLLAATEYFRTHADRNGWGPGLLRKQIEESFPGMQPNRGWHEPDTRQVTRERREQALAESQQRQQQTRQTRQERQQALEREFGPTLDAMTPEDLDQLARDLGPQVVKAIRIKGIQSNATRPLLLHELSQQSIGSR